MRVYPRRKNDCIARIQSILEYPRRSFSCVKLELQSHSFVHCSPHTDCNKIHGGSNQFFHVWKNLHSTFPLIDWFSGKSSKFQSINASNAQHSCIGSVLGPPQSQFWQAQIPNIKYSGDKKWIFHTVVITIW